MTTTYCPPRIPAFSASGAQKTLSAPSAKSCQGCKFVPPRDASHRRRRTPKTRKKLPSRPTAAAGLPTGSLTPRPRAMADEKQTPAEQQPPQSPARVTWPDDQRPWGHHPEEPALLI